jgi:sigma-B regulation protein RsbU (phosphoserine phosphatase)
VNRLLHEDIPDGRFVTFALLELDPTGHRGIFLSAGHGPSLYVVGESGEASSIDAQALPLAVVDEPEMEDAILFDFGPGDLIAIFSDGFFEWANGDGQQFGIARLREVICSNRHETAATIIERMDASVRDFTGGLPQTDDMTAVVVKRCES